MVGTELNVGSAQALRDLAVSRNAEAWESLLELHGRQMLAVCRRILSDEALAEDACQEALLIVRDRAGQFQGAGPEGDDDAAARSWVLRVACTTALKMLQKRRSDFRREDRRAREQVGAAEDRGEAPAMDEEQAAMVRRELERLPEEDRLPIVLHYYGGMGYGELALALNCPVGTAKARVHRGVGKLRRRLAVLGLLLAFEQVSVLLKESPAHAASDEGGLTAEQAARWMPLLTSARRPRFGDVGTHGTKGLTTMAKVGIGLAGLALGCLALVAARGTGAESGTAGRTAKQPAQQETQKALASRPLAGDAASAQTASAKPDDKRLPTGAPVALASKPATDEEKRAAVEGMSAFALDLYGQLKGEKGNLFFSPYSVSTALGMTWAGARGETDKQMAKTLRFALQQDRQHAAFAALIQSLNAETAKDGKKRGFQLSVANRLFGQKGYTFVPEFLAINKDSYGAPVQDVDFAGATEEARQTINKWVEEKTREKIKDLIQKGQLLPDVKLVLTNAIYFKGLWASQFKKERTQDAPFTLAGGEKVQAPTMQQTLEAGYFEIAGRLQALELPYAGDEISMVVLLPAAADGLSDLENDLTADNLKAWTGRMPEREVQVSLPRFKITWGTYNIVPKLQALGMTDACDPAKADFTGITTNPAGLFIRLVLHKAFVDVNEEGTEAAAATAVVMAPRGLPPKPRIFRADRPFLFLIREKATGSILFLGRVTDPRESK